MRQCVWHVSLLALLFVLSAGFFRSIGAGSLASLMPYANANALTERLLRERNLDRAIPLDGQVGGWNMGEDRGELRLHRRLEAGHDQRPILAVRKHRAEGAVGQRQAHLKPKSERDDTLIAQGAEDKIGVDRVARA